MNDNYSAWVGSGTVSVICSTQKEVVPLQYSFTSILISTFYVICCEGYYLSWLGNMNEPWGVETYASRKIQDDFNQSDSRQIHQVEHE